MLTIKKIVCMLFRHYFFKTRDLKGVQIEIRFFFEFKEFELNMHIIIWVIKEALVVKFGFTDLTHILMLYF